ncbi:uncharacterized protein PHALS_02533 [Plasmopara halstedii]|uniref:Uncharacterized protein n=1 Tax=Plasmopara halstedii TaxID=4781 RepID=A0A0P1AXY4_PLAHL|nr:uncharacterized protein PHALS_02533 [Plasmopara halstedii]CEG46111.1 hypothetical protein PHALS_02533 [Plasmopara halstedii]|eukprot:XP_024582480.1 hypothetical protein PHALS_02533 [Plasmopara halstedii]
MEKDVLGTRRSKFGVGRQVSTYGVVLIAQLVWGPVEAHCIAVHRCLAKRAQLRWQQEANPLELGVENMYE